MTNNKNPITTGFFVISITGVIFDVFWFANILTLTIKNNVMAKLKIMVAHGLTFILPKQPQELSPFKAKTKLTKPKTKNRAAEAISTKNNWYRITSKKPNTNSIAAIKYFKLGLL